MRKRGKLLSRVQQAVAFLFAILATVLVFRFPPYDTDSGLIGGTEYFLPGRPPTDNGDIWTLNSSLQFWELFCIGLTLCAALIAFHQKAEKSQRRCMLIGCALEAAFLGGSLPSINVILAPQFTWFVLNVLAALMLSLVFVLGRRSRRAVAKSNLF